MLGKLFGRRTVESERGRADEAFARGEHGTAKLAYERALSLVSATDEALQKELGQRVDACRDALARARITEAERLFEQDARELALGELSGAAEIAADPEIVADAHARMERLERREVRAQATLAEQSDDERFDTIAGSWEEEQFDEYESHGEALKAALLALHDGDPASARPTLEALVADPASGKPCYLWFELGRARSLCDDQPGAREAFEHFLTSLPEGLGGDARLSAHVELAAMLHDHGDFEGAVAQHQAAIEALPDDPRPYLAMAAFFRKEKLSAEAIEVLHAATDALQDEARPWRLTLELGLAHADQGDQGEAIELLEEVVSYFVARQHLDLPPECAVRLAELHEQAGNPARALDLFNLLAAGSDLPRLFSYHKEAARLLLSLGHPSDARRMLQRALELAPEQPEVSEELSKTLAELR